MGKAFLLISLIAVLLAASASAKEESSLTLLGVSEDGRLGITATLFLRTAPGSGNVFIEAQPVTKLDTRISLKLAKEIACGTVPGFSERCDSRDFFFRLESNASLVGGPSAGAAAGVLVISEIDDAPINRSVAVTGTLNSGALVGQVGGLKEKIAAAAASGISKALIPEGERYIRSGNNSGVVDLVEYGREIGIAVVEVVDLFEILNEVTGINYSQPQQQIEIDRRYSGIMQGLAADLCGRSAALAAEIRAPNSSNLSETFAEVGNAAANLTADGVKESGRGNYYSGASMCFGANVRYAYLGLLSENLSNEDALAQVSAKAAEVDSFDQSLPGARTLADLQVRGLVRERLAEARELIELAKSDLGIGSYNDGMYRLAFAGERLGSAYAWRRFLGEGSSRPLPSSDYNSSLRGGCVTRLQEAEEHLQYLEVYLPGLLSTGEELGPVYGYLRSADYSSCIYVASLTKAKANAMLSALGSGNVSRLVGRKLSAAAGSIARQTSSGEFPLVSYSYYEYASSLSSTDHPSSLLFAEYALELSSLDIYLDGAPGAEARRDYTVIASVFAGFLAGLLPLLAVFAARRFLARKRKKLLMRRKIKGRTSVRKKSNPGIAPRGAILGKKR